MIPIRFHKLLPETAANMRGSKCVRHLPEFKAINAPSQALLCFADDSWRINLVLFHPFILMLTTHDALITFLISFTTRPP